MCSHTSSLIYPCVCRLVHCWENHIFIQHRHSTCGADHSCTVPCRTSTSLIKPELSFHGNYRLGKSHRHSKFCILNGLCNLMACLNSSENLPATDGARSWAASMGRVNARREAGVTVRWDFPTNAPRRTGTFHDGPHALSILHVMARLACHIFAWLVLL